LTDLARAFAASLTDHDVDALGQLLSDGYVNHNPFVPPVPGPGSAVTFFTDWLHAFPDARVVCEDAIAAGTVDDGTVVGRFTYLGTFTNPILGIPPTGKPVVMRSIDIWRVHEGKFAEHWDELNTADWFAQLQGADAQPRAAATGG
jgi:steroid delta-isomerase-like uncharacterized protein